MTFEEAKKILEEEGFYVEKATRPCVLNGWFTKYESPEICEAVQVVCSAGYKVLMFETAFQARKERLKKGYEKNTKAPGPGEEQPKEDNPALAESASQFNDALLYEQAKKIAELTKEKSNLEDQITVLNACKKHNDKIDRKQIKCLGKEIARLNGIIHDKNAILSDVAEELRLTKIREKNLAELGLKYVGENEKLKKELADKVVDKINANALKSAESALAWKEKVIAEKDEEIADLGNELEATKKELEAFKESYKRRIKEDSDHFEHIQKICNAGLQKWLIESEYLEKDKPFRFPQLPDSSEEEEIRALKLQISELEKRGNGIDWKRNADAIKLYVNSASRERLWNPINQDICNEQELSFIINHGGKRVKYALRFDGTDIVYECSDPDKKPRIPTPEESKHDNGFEDFINKTIDNYNRRAANLGCVGSKDGNGISDQMVGVDIAEEGKDHSGVIVLCGKDFIDAIKKMK